MSISRLKRIGYGMAELGVSGSEVMLRVSLLIYYTQTVGIRADLASYAIALGVVWDAITDPLMGRISDHAWIKGQKRRPFMLPAAIGLAISLILVFNVPHLETQAGKFFYLLITYLSTNTFLTILSVPHAALGGDMSQIPETRMELFGWRLIFSNIGLIIGTLVPALIVLWSVKGSTPDALTSWIMASVILCSVSITLFATRGLDCAEKPSLVKFTKKVSHYNLRSYFTELSHVLGHKPFAWLLLAYMVATFGLTLNSSLALYYYKFFLKLDEVSVRGIIAFFMFIFCLSIPFWIWLTRFFSKSRILVINVLLLGLMTIFGYPNFPEGVAAWPILAAFFGGCFVGAVVLMDVAVADLADEQARQGREKESSNLGIYFGFWKMGSKLSRAFALIFTGNALAWIGFEIGEVPEVETTRLLSLLFGPGVGIFLLGAVFIIYWGQKKGVYDD